MSKCVACRCKLKKMTITIHLFKELFECEIFTSAICAVDSFKIRLFQLNTTLFRFEREISESRIQINVENSISPSYLLFYQQPLKALSTEHRHTKKNTQDFILWYERKISSKV